MRIPKWLVREVHQAEMIPRGYGIAYRSWMRDTATAMPFGIHLVVGILRYLYFSLLKAPVAWNDEQGRHRSRQQAYYRDNRDL